MSLFFFHYFFKNVTNNLRNQIVNKLLSSSHAWQSFVPFHRPTAAFEDASNILFFYIPPPFLSIHRIIILLIEKKLPLRFEDAILLAKIRFGYAVLWSS